MNFKTTYGLFAAFLVLLGVAAVFLLTSPKSGDDSLLLSGAKALKLAPKDFDSVTIDVKSPKPEKLVFQRVDEKRWRQTQPAEARVDSATVERIVDDLLSARKDAKDEAPKNLKDAGLAEPAIVITLARKTGDPYTVSLGNVTLGGANAKAFAISGERPSDPLAIRVGSLSSFLKTDKKDAATAGELAKSAGDFRAKELLLEGAGFNPSDSVTALKLIDGKNEIALAKQDAAWKFTKPENFGPAETRGDPATGENAGITGVEALVTALAAIKPSATDDVIDSPTDFAQYGLETGKEVGPKFEITRKAGDSSTTETLLVGKKDEPSGKFFVRLAGDKAVAKVPANLIDPVKKIIDRPGSLRDKTLLSFAPIGCDAIDVKLPGEANLLELRKTGEPPAWKLYDAAGESQPANTRTVTELLTAINGKIVKDFPDPAATDATLGFDRPSAEIALYVAGILPPEKKDEKKEEKKDVAKDKEKEKGKDEPKAAEKAAEKPAKPKVKEPSARLIFGRREKDLFYIRRLTKDKDGKEQKADFAVSETLWAKVTPGRLDYVDPTLPSFVPSSATKVNFWRGAEAFTVEKVGDNWLIRQPADRADRPADPAKVASLLAELANLAAVKLWSDKPSPREMERYGLATPKFKAVVSSKDGDKTAERTYLFGGETDDKTGWYAKQGERELVFVVSKVAVPDLEAGEIQDPVVFKIEPNKVTSIKLTGWKDVVGKPETRELERKGPGNWALKGDDKIKISPGQCESLLNALATVRAEKFVIRKSGPKDEQKLVVPAGGLEVSVQLEGEKDPVVLTIGAAEMPDNKQYFATSSKLPGDVFLLNKGLFEAIKAKPGFFAAE